MMEQVWLNYPFTQDASLATEDSPVKVGNQ